MLVALSRNLSLFVELQREILGGLFSKDTSVHIIHKAVSLDLSYFEDAEYYDKLQKAQRDGNYRPVQLLNQMFTLLENTVSIGSFFALARGFMRDTPILIFDEPTSHLDARAEAEIFEALEKFGKDKIVIIISHRLKTVRMSDKIIVLQKGMIVEMERMMN